jgi:hypothetical protein
MVFNSFISFLYNVVGIASLAYCTWASTALSNARQLFILLMHMLVNHLIPFFVKIS